MFSMLSGCKTGCVRVSLHVAHVWGGRWALNRGAGEDPNSNHTSWGKERIRSLASSNIFIILLLCIK